MCSLLYSGSKCIKCITTLSCDVESIQGIYLFCFKVGLKLDRMQYRCLRIDAVHSSSYVRDYWRCATTEVEVFMLNFRLRDITPSYEI
jgi:hypothetical protein